MSNDSPRSDRIRESGKFAFVGLERVIHERARLSILSSLSAHPQGLLFNDLKSLCDLTDGNLSRQLQALKDAEMVEVWKGIKHRRPQTMCRLTEFGRKRFLEYIAELEKVVGHALAAQDQSTARQSTLGQSKHGQANEKNQRPTRLDIAGA